MARRELGLTAFAGGMAFNARKAAKNVPISSQAQEDHFITRDGFTFAGSHLIVDLWEAEGLDDKDRIEQAMRDAVDAAGATLLHIHPTPSRLMAGSAAWPCWPKAT